MLDVFYCQRLGITPRAGEANDGGYITQLSALCINAVCFLGHSLLP